MKTDTKNQDRPGLPHRLESLDALRGFDMFFIMGGASLIVALANLFPESHTWSVLAQQMSHVEWDGLRHHDTIFPLFLFISGVSFPFSLQKQWESGKDIYAVLHKTVKRGLILFFLGLVCNGFLDFEFAQLRIWSVLGRIGLAWMFAAIIYTLYIDKTSLFKGIYRMLGVIALLLLGYYLITILIPAPDGQGAGVFTMEGNIACYLDRTLFGSHCYRELYDPEGMLSTVPAIGTALLGMLAGRILHVGPDQMGKKKKVFSLVFFGLLTTFLGFFWGRFYPINKALWSGSFVLAVAGYSFLTLALFYYIIDVLKLRKWAFFFKVIGMNSIAIFMLPRFIDFYFLRDRLFGGLLSFFPDYMGQVTGALSYIMTCWLFLYILYRYRIFLKV